MSAARAVAGLAVLGAAGAIAWALWRRQAPSSPSSRPGAASSGSAPSAPASADEGTVDYIVVNVERMAENFTNVFLPRGIRNKNPGNIRWITEPARRWRGMIANDGGGYGVFDELENGLRALARELLLDESRGLYTVRQIITNWAPPVENATGAYVAAVAQALHVGADDRISISARLPDLMAAMIRHENGRRLDGADYVSGAEIAEGIRRAAT